MLNLARRNDHFASWPLATLQRAFTRRHTVLPCGKYFDAVLRKLGRTPAATYEEYREEVRSDVALREVYEAAVAQQRIRRKYDRYDDRFANEANVVNYYALIRELQPRRVVETGTATGSMTSWVLAALSRNGNGDLVSIDLAPRAGSLTMDISVAEDEIGFLIPGECKGRWDYRSGDAKTLLPKVLLEQPADIFIHDSLHTRTHMLFEYNVARALMRPGSVILSDDILWNTAWFSFLESHDLRGLGCISNPNLGFTVNSFDSYELAIGVGVQAGPS